MIHAAGIMICSTDGKVLFLKRGPGGDSPGEWCFPGGRLEGDETAIAAAVRETEEESGYKADPAKLIPWTRRIANRESTGAQPTPAPGDTGLTAPAGTPPGTPIPVAGPGEATVLGGEQVDFTTFICKDVKPFIPDIEKSGEHVAYAWAPPGQPPEPLHPGCRIALQRLDMDELGVARAIQAGELTSPQFFGNVWLFALRITGTGLAYRTKIKEYVWRDPSIYLNPEFVARCNGLPVIMEHPKTKAGTLTSKEFNDRVIGTIMLPYIVGEDVWGVARIYDSAAAAIMQSEQLSTSPAVVWRDPKDNDQVELEDGSKFLIEGKPSLLDHLAVCALGVWDKGGEPTGVATTASGDQHMTEEEKKAAEEKARADAAAGQPLDKLLKGIDAVTAKLDAMSGRMDSMEKRMDDNAKRSKDDDDDAAKRKDAAKKRADAHKFSRRKDDDDDDSYKSRHDAEEGELAKHLKESGEPEETAADKAKKARKDAEEGEAKERADAKRRKDDDDKARKDSDNLVTKDDLNALRQDLASKLPRSRTDEESAAFADAQARADQAYSVFGKSAPRPLDGETLLAYRRRLLTPLKEHSPHWKGVELTVAATDSALLGVAEAQIIADAIKAGMNPASVPENELRAIPKTLETGHREIRFAGRPRTWMTRFMHGGQSLSKIRSHKELN